MFENSNRFEEKFMTPFITDVEILLETEDRIPVRPIPPNDSVDKIGDLIGVNTDFPEGKEAEEKVEVKVEKARGVKKKNKFNILPFLKGLVFSFDDLEEVEKNREKKRSKERSKEKSKEKGEAQVGLDVYVNLV